ncbi:glutathione S-transferase family protein [Ramlibacter henchirensis]|uniref:Glutathione S-transferase family protein n=1 Tax=Ramlibacter henchirensis TaxID=204072 RepID=A0A4Z0C2M9_9BURK|nr:glutathione S-transferase family protein [Ramlibacter henchirensis]TFZ05927.1 glutathione S-transferase family protein [Ramlibacter henchirensis]
METRITGNPHGLLLYDYPASPCARRVRITLVEKGLAWDTQQIDLSRLEQRHPDYLAINPNGLVPVLAHGERVLWESSVITQYLDDAFPQPRLYPDDPWELAQVRAWQGAAQAMGKDYRPLLYQRLIGPIVRAKHSLEETLAIARLSTQEPADLHWEARVWNLAVLTPSEQEDTEERLYAWLDELEDALHGRVWLVGERFSQAEISVYPPVAMLPHLGISIDEVRYPRTRAWMHRLENRPSFVQTLTKQDKALQKLARSGVLAWLGRVVALAPRQRTLWQKAGLRVLRGMLLKADRANAPRAGRRQPIRKPQPARVPPASRTRPLWPVDLRMAAQPYVLRADEAAPETAALRRLLNELGLTCAFEPGPRDGSTVLRHGLREVRDVGAIAEYAAAVTGDDRWFPRDIHLLARARMWLAFDEAMHKEYLPLAWEKRPGANRPRFDRTPEHARALLRARLDTVEAELSSRPYLLGPRPCFADLALHARFSTFPGLGIAIGSGSHPAVREWLRRLEPVHAEADETIRVR